MVTEGPASPGRGRPKGAKSTAAQVRVRRDKTVELTLAGYSLADIAEAFDVTQSVVAQDRQVMRRHLGSARKLTWRSPRPSEPLESFDWRGTAPDPNERQAYRRTTPVRSVESLYRQLTASNGTNRLAHNIDAARAAGDTRWLAASRSQVDQTMGYLAGMLELFDNYEAQQLATTTAGRDDLVQRSLDSSHVSQPLPVKGSGVLPTTTMAWIWRYWYAGIPLDGDEKIAGEISRKLNITQPRVMTAIKEFLARIQG